MAKTKSKLSVSPLVFKSIAHGMIAWLRTRGVHAPSQLSKPILKPGKIQLTPGTRSFNLFFSALLLICQSQAGADIRLESLRSLGHSMEGRVFQHRGPILHEGLLNKNRVSQTNPVKAGILTGAISGGILGAFAEPSLLTTKKELLLEDPAERNLPDYLRSNAKANAKGLGFLVGTISAGVGSYTYVRAGGGLTGLAAGIASGAAINAVMGSAVRGSWSGAFRWGLFGAGYSIIGIAITHKLASLLSK